MWILLFLQVYIYICIIIGSLVWSLLLDVTGRLWQSEHYLTLFSWNSIQRQTIFETTQPVHAFAGVTVKLFTIASNSFLISWNDDESSSSPLWLNKKYVKHFTEYHYLCKEIKCIIAFVPMISLRSSHSELCRVWSWCSQSMNILPSFTQFLSTRSSFGQMLLVHPKHPRTMLLVTRVL